MSCPVFSLGKARTDFLRFFRKVKGKRWGRPVAMWPSCALRTEPWGPNTDALPRGARDLQALPVPVKRAASAAARRIAFDLCTVSWYSASGSLS